MGADPEHISCPAGSYNGADIEKETKRLEDRPYCVCNSQYYSYSGDRSYVYTLLLNPTFGILKPIYEVFGWDTRYIVNLFGNSKYAFWTVTATWVFYSGFNMIIFLAQMGAIDKKIYEAAVVDGATPWQLDRYITIPLMKNVFGTCVTLASIAMVSQFDIIYMTTKGGPGTSTLNLPTYLYKIMTLENNYGKANAVGVIQIALGVSLVILIRRLFRDKEEVKEG
ncbi:MAG: sugar ABC transporter permease [Clostridiales bacterium]|nr:sugar ABC transporter permease [Clostridiales bacterium]